MDLKPLKATLRELSTKSVVKNLRKAGEAPAVIYGKGVENKTFSVNVREFKKIWGPGTRNTLIGLDFGDGQQVAAIVYGVQKHAISQDILHIDFKLIDEDGLVKVKVPVVLTGDPVGVKNEGGLLVKLVRSVKVSCKPSEIPAKFEIDISPIGSGVTYYFENLELPENVKPVTSARTVIFAIQKGRGKK